MAEIQTAGGEIQEQAGDVLYCTVHPTAETSLRCNKCGRPMCGKCAVRTPVGYRCRECVKGQQKVFYTAGPTDQLIQGAIALSLGGVATAASSLLGIIPFLGWWLAFLVGGGVGAGIADLAHRAVRKRRGQHSSLIVGGGIALSGGLVVLVTFLLGPLPIVQIIFLVMAISGAVGRLRLGR